MRMLITGQERAVAVEDGRIVELGGSYDLRLEIPDGEIRPGQINAHDHLHRNHYGRLGRPPYRNAYAWAHDIQARCGRHIADRRHASRRDALLIGAWKNLFAGVTAVAHHDAWEADFDRDFPLRVARGPSADSLGMTPALEGLEGEETYWLHLAEGVDLEAAEEVRALAARGLLTSGLIAAHGVGVDPDGVARLRACGAAVAWCPTSNLFLFGRTAPAELLAPGIDVLLGSDSRLTGDGDLLDELRCARTLGLVDEHRLEAAVGSVAARRLGLAEPSLEPGAPADLIVLTRPLLDAGAEDVALVMVGGVPRVARPDLAASLDRHVAEPAQMRIGDIVRWVKGPLPTPSSMRFLP
jgi:cytosine/adenosine deaminase-related metal-dependent hydrolase